MRRVVALVGLVMTVTIRGDAQELTASAWSYAPFGLNDLDRDLPPSGEFRLTLPLSDRLALEPFATVGWNGRYLEGFWGAQRRHRIPALTRESVSAFVTYGAAAYYSSYGLLPPIIGHIGFGVHRRLTKRLAFRPEVQVVTFHVVPIGVRFAAGLSVNLGS